MCIFVDNGVLRRGRPSRSSGIFASATTWRFVFADAAQRFLGRLAGVTEPGRKRKIIGEEFIAIFEEQAKALGASSSWRRGRSTRTGSSPRPCEGPSATIKTHHNVGGLPETMKLKLVEPLKDLFKDEVRQARRRARARPGVRAQASLSRPRARGAGARGGHGRARR